MEEIKTRILEDQVDTLAEKVATLTAQMAALLKLIRKPNVMERIGIDQFDVRNIQDHMKAVLAADRHQHERNVRTRDAEREADLTEMLSDFRRQRKQPAVQGRPS